MRIHGQLTRSFLVLTAGSAIALAQTTGGAAGTGNTGSAGAGAGAGAGAAAGAGHAGHGQGQHSADHGMGTNKGAGTMVGPADQQFMMKAAMGGLMEVEVSRLAQEKATNSQIKEYARQLEQDHQKANEQLKTLASQKNVDLPTTMGEHQKMVDKLRNLSGDKFDQQFMKMQVQHHRKDVNEFQKHTNRAMDSDIRNFASATLPKLQEHLRQAQDLQGSTRGRKANSSMSSDSGSNASGTSGSGSNTSGTSGSQSNENDSSARPQGYSNPTPNR